MKSSTDRFASLLGGGMGGAMGEMGADPDEMDLMGMGMGAGGGDELAELLVPRRGRRAGRRGGRLGGGVPGMGFGVDGGFPGMGGGF